MLEDEAIAKDYWFTIQCITASIRKVVVIVTIYRYGAVPWAMFLEADGESLSRLPRLVREHKVPFLDKPSELILCHDHILNGIRNTIHVVVESIRKRLVHGDSITSWASAHCATSSPNVLLNTENCSATNHSCPPLWNWLFLTAHNGSVEDLAYEVSG
jgi:hypothetical protein